LSVVSVVGLSGRGLCDGLITRPEESYRLWRVVVCDLETSEMRRLKLATWLWKIQPQWVVTPGKQTTNNCNIRRLWVSVTLDWKVSSSVGRSLTEDQNGLRK